jgi:hypothetical protein
MALEATCRVCGGTNYVETFEGGDLVCGDCGTQGATASQRSVTNDFNPAQIVTLRGARGTTRTVQRTSQKRKRASSGPSAASVGAGKKATVRAIDGLLAFQWVLQHQAQWIHRRQDGVSEALVGASRALWLRYVRHHTASVGGWFGAQRARRAKTAQVLPSRPGGRLSLAHTLAFIYLAARWIKEPIVPFDLARWCVQGDGFPYLSALHALPEAVRAKVTGAHELFNEASRSAPDALHIARLAQGVAVAVDYPPTTLNAWPVAARFAAACGAERVVGKAQLRHALRRIVALTGPLLRLGAGARGASAHAHAGSNNGSVFNWRSTVTPSLVLMAAVVVACKVVPGSDDALVRAARRADDAPPAYPRPHAAASGALAVRSIVQVRSSFLLFVLISFVCSHIRHFFCAGPLARGARRGAPRRALRRPRRATARGLLGAHASLRRGRVACAARRAARQPRAREQRRACARGRHYSQRRRARRGGRGAPRARSGV